jgi:FkbM family methyltransferase
MAQNNWVKSMGLDADGSLFVEVENGIRIYDLCFHSSLPRAVAVNPEDLMRAENRQLYYRFLTTLNEISGVMFSPLYDGGYQFKKGDVVVDAGARVGTFAAKVSAAVGEEGRIIAVEPEPRNYACLLKNIEANRLGNVIAVPKLLWNEARKQELYLSMYAASHSAYCDQFYNCTGESIIVEADTLDSILEALGIRAVNFIKMDIEGSEIEALKGMVTALESDVQMAIAAYHPFEGKQTRTVIVPQLERLGFKVTCTEDGIVRAKREGRAPPGLF